LTSAATGAGVRAAVPITVASPCAPALPEAASIMHVASSREPMSVTPNVSSMPFFASATTSGGRSSYFSSTQYFAMRPVSVADVFWFIGNALRARVGQG
jgi:hypothetical protein